jgi:hypothetical protein
MLIQADKGITGHADREHRLPTPNRLWLPVSSSAFYECEARILELPFVRRIAVDPIEAPTELHMTASRSRTRPGPRLGRLANLGPPG